MTIDRGNIDQFIGLGLHGNLLWCQSFNNSNWFEYQCFQEERACRFIGHRLEQIF